MSRTETIKEFYTRSPQVNPLRLSLNNADEGHFNVFTRENCSAATPYDRRDFYKISLILGTGTLYYADKWIIINRPALLFSNPMIPYAWEVTSEKQQGWFCLFTEAFITPDEHKGALQQSPLFRLGAKPVFFLDDHQQKSLAAIFEKMLYEIQSDYPFKYGLIRNYLHMLIHKSMKMQPAQNFKNPGDDSQRITSLFMKLLERQFPISSPEQTLQLTTAHDYAQQLSVHVNHLNRVVKSDTGKTTTDHIQSRIIQEARSLLQRTDWDISQIAYSLGFEYPAYFSRRFKEDTGATPTEIRQTTV